MPVSNVKVLGAKSKSSQVKTKPQVKSSLPKTSPLKTSPSSMTAILLAKECGVCYRTILRACASMSIYVGRSGGHNPRIFTATEVKNIKSYLSPRKA